MTTQWLSALKVVGIYLLVGVLWILFSDQLLYFSVQDPVLISHMQTLKGWFYVLVTAALLFVLINRALEVIDNANRLDPLTQLLRHQLFRERLETLLAQASEQAPLTLLYLDIDQFSVLNQKLGTDGADRLLKMFADALRDHSRGSALLARISTDQFAVAMPSTDSVSQAEAKAQALRQLLQNVALDFNVEVQCSIGIAMAPMDGNTGKLLMAAASHALTQTKQSNRSGILFFNHELSRREHERQEMLHDLRLAIASKSLSLVYQPQFTTTDLQLCGIEVLLRWNHPKHGFISPDIFIRLAEEHALMPQISAFVVETSYAELLPFLGKAIQRVSINVSALEFNSPPLIDALLQHIQRQPDYVRHVQLEITETAAITNLGASIELVERLRQQGLRLSLDDFGTGFSSLSMLKDLPIDEVKIDRSFVFELEQQPRTQAIVSAVIGITNDFGIKVVAEGVETETQRQLLHQLGCHELQGYLLASPQPLAQLWNGINQVAQKHKQLN